MASIKWFVLFIIAAMLLFFYSNRSKTKEKKLQQEYQAAIAAVATYKPELPDLPPRQDMEFPATVIEKLHRSVRSRNVEEASKAMDIMWKIHDGDVIPVMKKHLSARVDICWSDCSVITDMKNRVMDIITRDVSQLNFELLCIAAKDRNKDIRKRAVVTLANYPTEEALEMMNYALNDRESEIRTCAIEGVVRINNDIKRIREERKTEITNEYRRKTLKDRISPEEILKVLD